MVAPSDYGHAVADELHSDTLMRRGWRESGVSRRDSQIRRAPNASGLYDVLDLILDKGIVIDAFVRVSLVGIELLTVDLRVVIASVDTYLRYAEGVERLQVYNRSEAKRLPDMVGAGMKSSALKKGAQSVGRALTGKGRDDDEGEQSEQDDDQEEGGIANSLTRGVRNVVGRLVGGVTGDDDDKDDDESGTGRHERHERHGTEPQRGERRPKPAHSGEKR